jgi:S1-C subfamily serine protease
MAVRLLIQWMITDIIEVVSPNVTRIDMKMNNEWTTGVGSGVIIDSIGTVLTCEHVARPNGMHPQDISVEKPDGSKSLGEIINSDSMYDLAILKTDGLKMDGEFKSVNYDQVKVGQDGFVLGYPMSLPHLTLAKAIVSAKGKGLVKELPFEIIQIDARVNHGNSGGPFFTDGGEIAGIVTMKYIPFLQEISELEDFVNKVPMLAGSDMVMNGFSVRGFINYVNEAVRRMTRALDIVQVGIGWVIPVHFMSKII